MGPSPDLTPPADAEPARPDPAVPPPGTPMGAHYDMCFGCGERHPTGLRLETVVGEGVAVAARFTVADVHQGAPGLGHGGVLAAAFDEALGFVAGMLGPPAVTARLETDFLRPVPVGETLYIDARCTGVSGRKVYTEGEGRLGSPGGPVALRAAALFIVVDTEHFVRHGGAAVDAAFRSRFNP